MIGETMFVSGLAMFFTAPIAGRLSTKLDLRFMMAIGFVSFAAGTYIMTHLTQDWDFYELFIPQILRGFGLMMCMVPINNIALGTLPPQRIRGASGLFNLTRNLGGAVGLAVINTVLTTRQDVHYERLRENVHWGNTAAIDQMNNMTNNFNNWGLDGANVAVKQMVGLATKQAMILSFGDIFLMLTVLFLAMVLGVFMIKKPAPQGGGEAVAATDLRPSLRERPSSEGLFVFLHGSLQFPSTGCLPPRALFDLRTSNLALMVSSRRSDEANRS